MGKQRVALEHHADVALFGRQRGDVLAVEQDGAGVRFDEAGDGAKGGGFAAAAGSEQRHQLAIGNLQVEIVDGRRTVVAFGQTPDRDSGHSAGNLLMILARSADANPSPLAAVIFTHPRMVL